MGLDTRLVMTGDSDAKKSTKPLRPRQETQERMKPISHDSFKGLLKRAINPGHASEPQPKST
jgi:hypothetical protein